MTVGCHSFFYIMPLTLNQKKEIILELKENLKKQQGIVLVDFSSLSANDLADLRKELRSMNCLLWVAKKSLIKKALSDEKILSDFMIDGPAALVFGFDDLITPAKAVYQFTKKHEGLKILGGIWENQLQGSEPILSLAQLPSRADLLTKLVWSLRGSITGLVNVLSGPARGLTIALSEIQKQKS